MQITDETVGWLFAEVRLHPADGQVHVREAPGRGVRLLAEYGDITLRAAEGALCGKVGNCGSMTTDPNNGLPYTDGARAAGPDQANAHATGAESPTDFYLDGFPYLLDPFPGSPNGATVSP